MKCFTNLIFLPGSSEWNWELFSITSFGGSRISSSEDSLSWSTSLACPKLEAWSPEYVWMMWTFMLSEKVLFTFSKSMGKSKFSEEDLEDIYENVESIWPKLLFTWAELWAGKWQDLNYKTDAHHLMFREEIEILVGIYEQHIALEIATFKYHILHVWEEQILHLCYLGWSLTATFRRAE